ncbi:MAG: ABC transporter permease [Acidiferrobacterales bacterium]
MTAPVGVGVYAVDVLRFVVAALRGYSVRTGLMLLAMGIGVAAVVVLTSLGEGARRFVVGEFASLGTHLLIVLPGRSETTGGPPPLLGETPRDLTIDDAVALERLRAVRRVAPIVVGSAAVSWGRRDRESIIVGSTDEFLAVRHLAMGQGRFLPPADPRKGAAICVLGAKIRAELFGPNKALGQWVRIGDRRFRVIGVLASEGRTIGIDIEEVVVIPVASALTLLNTASLFRVLVEARTREAIADARTGITEIIRARHEGEDDITIVTQDAVLATFDRILRALTLTVAGIAAISLAVAGILIMNVMLVAVSQRRAEIGLLKALGASSLGIQRLFVAEAGVLSLLGALLGFAAGEAGSWFIGRLYPVLPVGTPWWAVVAALTVALMTGLAFSVLPARRAARLDPVQALSRR